MHTDLIFEVLLLSQEKSSLDALHLPVTEDILTGPPLTTAVLYPAAETQLPGSIVKPYQMPCLSADLIDLCMELRNQDALKA